MHSVTAFLKRLQLRLLHQAQLLSITIVFTFILVEVAFLNLLSKMSSNYQKAQILRMCIWHNRNANVRTENMRSWCQAKTCDFPLGGYSMKRKSASPKLILLRQSQVKKVLLYEIKNTSEHTSYSKQYPRGKVNFPVPSENIRKLCSISVQL